MTRIMASAALVTRGQIKNGAAKYAAGTDKALGQNPPPAAGQRLAPSRPRSGQADSASGITAGMRDLNLRQQSSPAKQLSNRRSFASNAGSNVVRNLNDVASMLRLNQAKNVVIVAGAGISTPSGIPDFRTPGTGLYDNLQQYSVPYPEAIFDIDFFHHNPRPFFALAKELYPSGKYRPNYIHYFARLLNDRGVLLRMYTQNIDGLERLAGLPPDKLVEAHGTFSSASCVVCAEKYRGAEIKENIFDEKLPKCRKRGCPGIIKPDIVFFGEELPKRFYYYLKDMLQTDLVLVMGTSLEVQPFAGIIDTVRWTIPRVLFNREPVGPFKRGKRAKDFVSQGDLLESMQSFAASAGMKEEMVDLITQCEGSFRLACPPPPDPARKPPKPAPANKTNPILAAMWRQNAKLNFYSDSDSSDTSSYQDSDSDSSSSDDKKPVNRRLPQNSRSPTKPPLKPRNSKTNLTSANNTIRRDPAASTRPPSGRSGPHSKNTNNSNASNSARNFSSSSSLLPKRREHKPSTPTFNSRGGNSQQRSLHTQSKDNSWTGNGVRRKAPIDVGLRPDRKPPVPGSHATKPRSHSVNKATPEKLRSTQVGGFRSVIDRVRSAKPPAKISYQHRVSPKPAFNARGTLNCNTSNSSSTEDDDEGDDNDDDSSSDDSR